MHGNCPYCKKAVAQLEIEEVQVAAHTGQTFIGVTYICPSCRFVLGASLDPNVIKTAGVQEIVSRLTS